MWRSEMFVDQGSAALVVVALYALLHGGQWARRTWRGKRHQRYATDRGFQFEPERSEEWTRHASTSEFARVYVLAGDDAAAVGALFTPEIRAYFVAHLGHSLAGAQRELIWWRHGSLPVGARLEAFLAEGDTICRRFVRG